MQRHGIQRGCDRLNADDKAKFLKYILGDTGINVTVGSSSQFTADTLYQINLATADQLGGILQAIAQKISSKNGKDF